ncbi:MULTISPECIES: MerR family transcriptional regulator [Clostridium]|uniref:MerR family transcriptional regulator n=1 Tax=Clostridium TaxID=1485 RepID=UPI0018A10402|nr:MULTISPECIES: MerR family transcriptional regulator [Clostridium]MDU3323931.1 MerR family transcriptional regulator [Escherichia coli]MDB2087475.1 MerR family transcriptional regulator [Clostridium paraputrificum]MDB2091968.1 MerR family transcriptional regulator [Clostridium paraputrificum]MDU1825148.1 MerR family transcriptional regulator [Clostridium sp.]MDU1841275.1 MerR family transcriptional regulator [Clostridium sp.]
MFTPKGVCEEVGISYETLKFYCKEGLVPNVKRDKNNYRIFDEKNIAWLKGLQCLKKCGMSIKDMKLYMNYCMEGPSTIPERKEMLNKLNESLVKKINDLNECIDFIENKQTFYDDVLDGKIKYISNLIDIED